MAEDGSRWSLLTDMHAGRPTARWESAVDHFLKGKKRIDANTRRKYRSNYTMFFRTLEEQGMNANVDGEDCIGEKEICYLLDVAWKDNAVSTREWYCKMLNMLLLRYGNTVIKDMELVWPQDERINVDWLEPMDMVMLLDAELTPLQELVIHLELCLGLRRIEVVRLMLTDIHNGYLHVRGKGRESGKWRTVSFHPDTPVVLRNWMIERKRMVSEALQYRPSLEVPETLIMWKRYVRKPQMGSYSENGDGIDGQVIDKLQEALGMQFGNHTLRRTCGRSMWLSGKVTGEVVPDATISRVYGHSDWKTTADYIGVNLDDMSDAMSSLSTYQNVLRQQKKELK